jgi:phosphate/sulfate permease
MIKNIVLSWIITLPATGFIAWVVFVCLYNFI